MKMQKNRKYIRRTDKPYPATRKADIMAEPLEADLAAFLGIPDIEAHKIVDAVGKVIFNRLLHGQPSGIPHVGIFHLRYLREKVYHNGFGKKSAIKTPLPSEFRFRLYPQCMFEFARVSKLKVRDEAPYTGQLGDHYERQKQERRPKAIPRRRYDRRRSETPTNGRAAFGKMYAGNPRGKKRRKASPPVQESDDEKEG